MVDYNTRAARAIDDANCVGLVARLYGKGGELVIKLLDNFPNKVELLWIESDRIATPLFLASHTPQGASKAVVVFEDFDTEELALMLVGKKLYAENLAQDLGEVSELDFLVGFDFVDLGSGRRGRVAEAFDNEFNPLIDVDMDGDLGRVLVPLAEPLIDEIDRKARRIKMRLPEGFFED